MNYEIKTDSSNQKYIEVPLEENQGAVRVTYIPDAWPDNNLSGIRIQMRDADGHLKPGPEVPENAVGELTAALINLIYAL